jgi:addiction module HigA family antidote
MSRIPTHRQPTHPGVMLREEFLIPLGISQSKLAEAIHVPFQRVNEIVRGCRGVTPSTALRLSKYFNTTPDFWLNLQMTFDLFTSQQDEQPILRSIRPNAAAHHCAAGVPAEAIHN